MGLSDFAREISKFPDWTFDEQVIWLEKLRKALGGKLERKGKKRKNSLLVPGIVPLLPRFKDEGIQLIILEILGHFDLGPYQKELLPFLSHSNPIVRGRILSLLTDVRGEGALSLLKTLIDFFPQEPDLKNQALLIHYFGVCGRDEPIPLLFESLNHPHFRIRAGGIEALAQKNPQLLLDFIPKLLRDKSPRVRVNCALALGKLEKAKLENGNEKNGELPIRSGDILKAMLVDPDLGFRSSACFAIGFRGEIEELRLLIPLLNDPFSGVRNQVVRVLSKFGDQFTTELLQQGEKSGGPSDKEILRIFKFYQDQPSLDFLKKQLKHPEAWIRFHALSGLLARMVDPQKEKALFFRYLWDSEPVILVLLAGNAWRFPPGKRLFERLLEFLHSPISELKEEAAMSLIKLRKSSVNFLYRKWRSGDLFANDKEPSRDYLVTLSRIIGEIGTPMAFPLFEAILNFESFHAEREIFFYLQSRKKDFLRWKGLGEEKSWWRGYPGVCELVNKESEYENP